MILISTMQSIFVMTLSFIGGGCQSQSQRLFNTENRNSAAWKHVTIWHEVLLNISSGSWPHRNLAVMEGPTPPAFFTLDLCPTFEAPGDELPSGRRKFSHAVGSVGKVKFIARPNNYTGIFQGAKYGIIRISLTNEPAPGYFGPSFGFGLKFLRDGVDSASVVVRYNNVTQKSWNLFSENLSNHYIGQGELTVSLAKFNAQASPYIAQVGLSDMARYGENGKYIPDNRVNYPYKLVFKPTRKIAFRDEHHGELQDDLKTIEKNTTLWEVHAWDDPSELGGVEKHIGDLVLTSPLVRSLYGDTKLFFRHQDIRDDFKLRPQWKKYTSAVGALLGVEPKCARDIN